MKDYAAAYLAELFEGVLKIYDFFTPEQARARRMVEFELLRTSGKLEGMCSSEVHKLFGIHRESNEI